MSKKLYALLLPVLAVAAFASMSGAAQAAPKWKPCNFVGVEKGSFADSECLIPKAKGNYEKTFIPNGEANKVQIVAFGKLKFTATNGVAFECKALAGGNIWNLAAGGVDNIEAFVNYECTSSVCSPIATEAKNLVWPTELVAGAPPTDKIGTAAKEIEITVTCGVAVATFHGILSPKIINPTETHPLLAEFTSATGELVDGTVKAKVEGTLNLVGFKAAETIFVE
jgi:hypothetical protein